MKPFAFCAMFTFAASLALAGEFNSTRNTGDDAPAWKNLPGVDGKEHSLADFAQKRPVVVIFTCNSCPIATDYEDRIIALAKKFADKVDFVAINVNRVPEDSLEKMKTRAEKKKFPYPYLFDESQQIAKDYGANFTPEFFVLSADRKIVYMGGMDDNSDAKLVKTNYLEPAVEAVLKGEKPATQETAARGCRIRFANARR
jgi:peroxiredoxin